MARTCDWLLEPPVTTSRCGKRAAIHHEAVYDSERLEGDFCAEHDVALAKVLKGVGFQVGLLDPVAKTKVDWKERASHVAASGTRFSSAEARIWLLEKGAISSPKGRLSRAHLRMYADSH